MIVRRKDSTENICTFCHKQFNRKALSCPFCGNRIISPELWPGTILHNGRYEIDKKLESGGMSVIYLAKDRNLENMQCIIKVMTDKFKSAEKRNYAIKNFKNEAVILARLRHHGLPVVQNHFIEDGRYCLVMDYVEGKTLESILFESLLHRGLPGIDMVINWAIQICHILDYLHTYEPMVIHGDIKPGNLMENKRGHIMLLDFGIAHIFEGKRPEPSMGTSGYAAPEQYGGKVYPQSDIFALGVTLHRLLTGYEPGKKEENLFIFPPLSQFRNDIPTGLQSIISKATQIEVENRFPSAGKFREALIELSEGQGKKALLEELKEFLITLAGPEADRVMEDCMNKLGCNKESFTTDQMDSLIEMFSCKFNFTADDALKMTDKIQELIAQHS